MDDTSRLSTTETGKPRGAARWPVLARLPDVSAEVAAMQRQLKPAADSVNYRFDPPQMIGLGNEPARSKVAHDADRAANSHTTVSRSQQPHVFDRRSRNRGQMKSPAGDSPILPASNPFSIPGTRLVDALAPALRFLTLVALFTAAGIWIQTINRRDQPAGESTKPADASVQAPAETIKDAVERAARAATATGPLGAANEQRGVMTATGPQSEIVSQGPAAPPFLAAASGQPLPQVRTTEPEVIGFRDNSTRLSTVANGSTTSAKGPATPAIARLPGQVLDDTPR